MRIIITPQQYSGAFSDLIYKIDECNSQQVTEVEIWCSSKAEPVGMKRFIGDDTYIINTSNYVSRFLDVNPIISDNCEIISSTNRTVQTKIKIGNVYSAERSVTAGCIASEFTKAMSNSPYFLDIAPGESDEISVMAYPRNIGANITIYGEGIKSTITFPNVSATLDVCTFVFNMDNIATLFSITDWNKIWEMEVNVLANTSTIISRRYNIKRNTSIATRLCWLNPYGAIDYYTFPITLSRQVKASKSKIYSQFGYATYGNTAETVTALKTAYESPSTLEWLAEIITSPRVWIIDNKTLTPVDVVSDSTDVILDDLNAMTISIRPKVKAQFQKM